MSIEKKQLRNIVEGALLAAGAPLTVTKLVGLFEKEEAPSAEDVKTVLEEIQADCEQRGFELKEVGTGWRFQVREENAPWVNRLWEEKPQKYSRALLETLALIAYRQPITRGDIEEIRGVAVSSHIIKTLTERDWVKVVGHRDVPGRPSLYATTRQFLDYFNLSSLEDLPSLSEISDFEKLNPEMELALAEETAKSPETEPAGNSTEVSSAQDNSTEDSGAENVSHSLETEESLPGSESDDEPDSESGNEITAVEEPNPEEAADQHQGEAGPTDMTPCTETGSDEKPDTVSAEPAADEHEKDDQTVDAE